MRIALIVHEFPCVSETFIVDKFLGLLARGYDVHVVADRERRDDYPLFPSLSDERIRRRIHAWRNERALADNLDLVVMRTLRAAATRPLRLVRALTAELGSAGPGALGRAAFAVPLATIAPDILHFEFGSLAAHRLDLKAATGAKVAVSFRGFDVNYYGLDRDGFYDDVWRAADGLHFLGDDLYRRAVTRGLRHPKLVVRIPPAVDATAFRPRPRLVEDVGTASRPLRLLSVGRLHWKKGYEFALAAVAALSAAGIAWEYRIVGDGPFAEATEACIEDLGLGERVRLLGAVGRDRVRAELDGTDVFLHPAVSEGFCNAALEAQAMEVPVVATDADGLRECVADGTTGLIVPRRDAAALAEALLALARDAERRAEMGRAGRRRVIEQFDPKSQIDAFAAFYERLHRAGRS